VDGVISETTAGSSVLFSRAANSTTILNKVNTYTGDTQLFMGGSTITLKMGIANAISSSSRVLVSSSTTGTGFFDLNGYNQNVRAVSDTVGGDLVVTNSSATTDAELRFSTTDAQAFGGWVQDGATRKTSLVMSGSGSQSFTNINTYTGGTRIDSGTLTLGHASNTLADTGAINVNGGTLALGTNSDTVGAVTLTSGSITATGSGTLTGSSYDVRSGSISARLAGANVALTKSTSGTVTLTGANTYTGATNVDAGKLVISSTGSTAAGSTVTVSNAGSELVVDGTLGGPLFIDSGATLSGSGTISGSATIAGIHNAGNSPGVQTFSGDLGYQAGSTVNWELGGKTTTQTLPAIFDQIVVGGNLSFASTTTVNLLFNTVGSSVDWGNALWDSNQSWTLFDVAGTTTGLENVALTTSNWADSNGTLFDTARNGSFFTLSLSGQDVMLNYTAVPETSVSLLGGLSALLLMRRRRVN
jgi:autotransporter-associated beta strand protein